MLIFVLLVIYEKLEWQQNEDISLCVKNSVTRLDDNFYLDFRCESCSVRFSNIV